MHGTGLVTTEEIVCLYSPGGEDTVERLTEWAETTDIRFTPKPVGDGIEPAPDMLGLSVGGDGTFLQTLHECAPAGIPLAGINRGTLSFLARIPPATAPDALEEILRGDSRVCSRERLHVTTPSFEATGVNDVTIEALASTQTRTTCRLSAYLHVAEENQQTARPVGTEFLGVYDGGGAVVSTPTGSTAMGLSAGGPVHAPRHNSALQVTALHHDGLGERTVVFDATTALTLVPDRAVHVSVDGGRTVGIVGTDQRIRITGANEPAYIVRTSIEPSFFAALSEKLNWTVRKDEPASLQQPAGVRRDSSQPGDQFERGRLPATARDERPSWLLHRKHPGPADNYEWASRVAREAATAAGTVIQQWAQRIEQAESTAERSTFATRAEQRSQQVLTAALARAFPDHHINASGEIQSEGNEEYTWFVDAIDGRTNFEHSNPNYCTTLALVEDGVPVVGVVYAPETGELFHAIRGRTAYRNGVPIEPTDRVDLELSMLLSGYDPDGEFLQTFYPHVRGVRRLGSQALNLCFVAAGSADGVWEYDTYPWDVAAGLCILRAAGGRVSTPTGERYTLAQDASRHHPLLASNSTLHTELVSLVVATDN